MRFPLRPRLPRRANPSPADVDRLRLDGDDVLGVVGREGHVVEGRSGLVEHDLWHPDRGSIPEVIADNVVEGLAIDTVIAHGVRLVGPGVVGRRVGHRAVPVPVLSELLARGAGEGARFAVPGQSALLGVGVPRVAEGFDDWKRDDTRRLHGRRRYKSPRQRGNEGAPKTSVSGAPPSPTRFQALDPSMAPTRIWDAAWPRSARWSDDGEHLRRLATSLTDNPSSRSSFAWADSESMGVRTGKEPARSGRISAYMTKPYSVGGTPSDLRAFRPRRGEISSAAFWA
jgi:hypothetical protein